MDGLSALGTTLSIGGSPVAGLTNISGPGISADTIDTSGHDNTDRYRTFVGGPINGGEVSVEGNLTTAIAAGTIKDALDSGEEQSCEIAFPNGTKWVFGAVVVGFESDAPYDGKMAFSGSLQVSGKPEITDAV